MLTEMQIKGVYVYYEGVTEKCAADYAHKEIRDWYASGRNKESRLMAVSVPEMCETCPKSCGRRKTKAS